MKTDLHIHTNFSDGAYTPEKIIDTAIDVGLDAIALTDHDNILSYAVAQNYLKQLKNENKKTIEVLQGIEVNTIYKNCEIHILGYFMNPEDSDFKNLIKMRLQLLF